jgi:elongation factor P
MSAIDVNKLKVGVTFEDENGDPFKVMKYDFAKIGRGNANIKVKARNLLTGAIVQKSYGSGNRVEEVLIEKKELQYLYNDGKTAFFMDPRSFEQTEIPLEVLGDDLRYLVDGENVWVQYWDEKVLGVDLPASVVLTITETEPGAKGNSVTNVYKPAKTNSGLQVQVPLFIGEGDKIKVNTLTGEYVNRVNL